MCLAVPGRIVEISAAEPLLRNGRVDFSGVDRWISLAYLPEARVHDYVIVHAGLAIALIDEQEAAASLQAFADLDASIDAA